MACAGTAACLVAEAPKYETPKQTPPFLDVENAAPSIAQVWSLTTGTTLLLSVPVRSDDAGEDIRAMLVLKYPTDPEILDWASLAASTLDDEEREELQLSWTPNNVVERGCFPLTLIVTHEDNFLRLLDNVSHDAREPVDQDDVAVLTWWVTLGDSPDDPILAADCKITPINSSSPIPEL